MNLAPMKGKKKPRRVWIYIGDESSKRLDSLLRNFPALSEAATTSVLLDAALRCCEREGFTALPHEFRISEKTPVESSHTLRLNDK